MKPKITTNTSFIAIALLLLCAVENTAHAATITVTNTNDSGAGSLRQALTDALDGDIINFAVTGTIGVTGGELLVDSDITISGPGAASLAVDGNGNSRVFHIDSDRTVTISGLTIANGMVVTPNSGGGIWSDHATLTLNDCTISDNSGGSFGGGIYNDGFDGGIAVLTSNNSTFIGNSARYGGGIFNDGFAGLATMSLNNSVLSGNSAENFGGGIFNDGASGWGTLTLNNTTLSNSSANDSGGGIYNDHGLLTLSDSAISSNSAQNWGGGIYNDGSQKGAAWLTISGSTLKGNSAATGGGIFNDGEQQGDTHVQISNSTFSENAASYGGGIASDGYYGFYVIVQMSNSTFSGNSASEAGGAIYNFAESGQDGMVSLMNTILQAGATGGNIFNDSGTVTSLGYNLSSDDGGGFLTGPGDQINTDPVLGPLQDNGGPTFTHELLPGSPAIDAGDPNFTPPPFFDQRGPGFDRVVNGRIDIGSFEVQGPTPTPITLSAHRRRVQGRHTVDLSWYGATSAYIDIYRDGEVIATAPNNGAYKDFIGVRGGNIRYIYKVCDAGTQNYSNQVTVRFGGASAVAGFGRASRSRASASESKAVSAAKFIK